MAEMKCDKERYGRKRLEKKGKELWPVRTALLTNAMIALRSIKAEEEMAVSLTQGECVDEASINTKGYLANRKDAGRQLCEAKRAIENMDPLPEDLTEAVNEILSKVKPGETTYKQQNLWVEPETLDSMREFCRQIREETGRTVYLPYVLACVMSFAYLKDRKRSLDPRKNKCVEKIKEEIEKVCKLDLEGKKKPALNSIDRAQKEMSRLREMIEKEK